MSMMRSCREGGFLVYFLLRPENQSVQNVPPCFMGKPVYRNPVSHHVPFIF